MINDEGNEMPMSEIKTLKGALLIFLKSIEKESQEIITSYC